MWNFPSIGSLRRVTNVYYNYDWFLLGLNLPSRRINNSKNLLIWMRLSNISALDIQDLKKKKTQTNKQKNNYEVSTSFKYKTQCTSSTHFYHTLCFKFFSCLCGKLSVLQIETFYTMLGSDSHLPWGDMGKWFYTRVVKRH